MFTIITQIINALKVTYARSNLENYVMNTNPQTIADVESAAHDYEKAQGRGLGF